MRRLIIEMNRSILETAESALTYIESHLTQKINIADIAQVVHLSKYHTHRLISHALGQSLMNYIRARKLSASIELLLKPHYNIIDISNYFAFEHEQSYIRAFKKLYGITPAQFRKVQPNLSLKEKADLSHLTEIYEGLIFKPKIIFKSAIHLVGKRHRIHVEDNLQNFTANSVANDFILNDKESINHKFDSHVYIGFTKYESWEEESYSYYFPSVQVSSFSDIPSGLEVNSIPGSKYAVFTYVGSIHPRYLTIRHLEQIYNYIQNYVHVQKPSFYQSEPFHFEYINENVATDHYCEVDIYFPIQSLPVR